MKTRDNTIGAGLLVQTNRRLLSACLLSLRLAIGIMLFIAGAGKVLGWFGGFGMDVTIQFYGKMGISIPLTYLSSYTEFLGGFLLAVGLLARPAAFAVMINMTVATIVSLPNGFLAPMGASYPLMFLIIAAVILLAGPMAWSIDSLLATGRNATRGKADWNDAALICSAA